MDLRSYQNKDILIMGLGVHGGGVIAAKFFAKLGANVLVTDLKTEKDLSSSVDTLKNYPNVSYVLGEHRETDFKNVDLVIRNPGVPKESKYLQIARDNGIEVQMQEGIFLKLCPTRNIIGVTGTKGKTTTAYLIYEMLKANGLRVHMGGNMKIPVLSILDKINRSDWVVLELSSWHCEALDDIRYSPHIGVITNMSQDHLNRYKSFTDYALSKSSIFKYQKHIDYFVTIKNGLFTREYLKLCRSNNLLFDSKSGEIVDKFKRVVYKVNLQKLANSNIKGKHNVANMLCALTVSINLKLNFEASLKAVIGFKGVQYRQQEIGMVNGILFVNDTTATAPAALMMAIDTYKNRSPVFIMGGTNKGLDYKELAEYVLNNKVDYVLLNGSATSELVNFGLDEDKVYDDFKSAVKDAFKMVRSQNGSVVLSPGAASFGMFKHEFDRGDQFNKCFKEMKQEYEA